MQIAHIVRSSAVIVALVLVACDGSPRIGQEPSPLPPTEPTTPTPPAAPPFEAHIFVAGDIALRDNAGARATGALIARTIPDLPNVTVIANGDIAYNCGEEHEFRDQFHPAWGSFKSLIRPVPGNHEYCGDKAEGYHWYFGSVAGTPGHAYYQYQVGPWQVYALDSVRLRDPSLPQPEVLSTQFLISELPRHQTLCTMAYWHNPGFSSVRRPQPLAMDQAWKALADNKAEIVVNADDHIYERFALMDRNYQKVNQNGIRKFIAGTGGADLRQPTAIYPTSEAIIRELGVLHLTIRADRYEWEFLTVSGGKLDRGTDPCYGPTS